MRGAWIEIAFWMWQCPHCRRSLPMRGAWIEILMYSVMITSLASLPMRGAWIEITTYPWNT